MLTSIKNKQEAEVGIGSWDKPKRKAHVVIVGAGLAGLAAAQRLYEAGIRDVVILEGQGRLGGRVHTVDHSDYVLEMGAQWLHGADQNPLYQWLIEKNMLDDFEDASMGFQGIFCTGQGDCISPELVRRVLDIVVESKLTLSKNRFLDLTGKDGYKNAAEIFRHQLEAKLNVDSELNNRRETVNALFEWFLRYETIENSCDSMDEVSIASYTDWTDSGDGTLLNFKHGYRSLLDWFCSHIPAESWIYLNKPVHKIEMLKQVPRSTLWHNDQNQKFIRPMLVEYWDGDDAGKSDTSLGWIECDHVIVTVSLGVLKSNHTSLFKPPLPEYKQELINSLGFGTVNKIVLEFDRPFWATNNHGIKLVWNKDIETNFPVWARDILAFDVVRRQPNLLIGWIGGRGAKLMESESDEDIAQVCLDILASFLPHNYQQPNKLVGCVCSRWYSNPYTRGSYSFQSMKSLDYNVEKLQEPLYNSDLSKSMNKLKSILGSRLPRVLFAGEATAGKLYSTTHGAIISGWREADRLKDHLIGSQISNIQQSSVRVCGENVMVES